MEETPCCKVAYQDRIRKVIILLGMKYLSSGYIFVDPDIVKISDES